MANVTKRPATKWQRGDYVWAAELASGMTEDKKKTSKALLALSKSLKRGKRYDESSELFELLRRIRNADAKGFRKNNTSKSNGAEADIMYEASVKAGALILK
jgi:hypothetical protein